MHFSVEYFNWQHFNVQIFSIKHRTFFSIELNLKENSFFQHNRFSSLNITKRCFTVQFKCKILNSMSFSLSFSKQFFFILLLAPSLVEEQYANLKNFIRLCRLRGKQISRFLCLVCTFQCVQRNSLRQSQQSSYKISIYFDTAHIHFLAIYKKHLHHSIYGNLLTVFFSMRNHKRNFKINHKPSCH